jgi:hypothetical protein
MPVPFHVHPVSLLSFQIHYERVVQFKCNVQFGATVCNPLRPFWPCQM